MSSREANIKQLNYAIMTLNEDADEVHGLISKSADELENATAASNRAADNAAKIIESLTPLTELLETQHRDSTVMLEEAKRVSDKLQTDMFGFKNTTSTRLDGLKSEISKAESTIKELEEKIAENANSIIKKLLIPIYAVIGLGIVDLICLVMLLMR